MNDLERRLKELPLAEPGPECDRRIERLFLETPDRPQRFWKRPIALWQCLAACVLCVVMGFLATRVLSPPQGHGTQLAPSYV